MCDGVTELILVGQHSASQNCRNMDPERVNYQYVALCQVIQVTTDVMFEQNKTIQQPVYIMLSPKIKNKYSYSSRNKRGWLVCAFPVPRLIMVDVSTYVPWVASPNTHEERQQ